MDNLRVTQGNKEDALTSNYVPFILAGRFTFKQCFIGCKVALLQLLIIWLCTCANLL